MKQIILSIAVFGSFIYQPPIFGHFIYPLGYCLLADICNHTWIPECGKEPNGTSLKLFIDECDVMEYNCDNDKDYRMINYSDCFASPQTCATFKPCPTFTPCKKKGDKGKKTFLRHINMRLVRHDVTPKLPVRMLKGKRRYTPEATRKIKRRYLEHNERRCRRDDLETGQTKPLPKRKPKAKTKRTLSKISIILKTIVSAGKRTIVKHGKKFLTFVRRITKTKTKKVTKDSDFLE